MSKNSFGRLTESTYMILLATKEPIHGYGIIQNVKKMSNQTIVIGAGTLYGVLKKMILNDFIRMNEVEGQKIYQITNSGLNILNEEIVRLQLLLTIGKEVTNGLFEN